MIMLRVKNDLCFYITFVRTELGMGLKNLLD